MNSTETSQLTQLTTWVATTPSRKRTSCKEKRINKNWKSHYATLTPPLPERTIKDDRMEQWLQQALEECEASDTDQSPVLPSPERH